jgi:hypothetical protein
MVAGETESETFFAHCIKCGKEFILKEGRLEQKKRRKIKESQKGITITRAEDIEKSTDPALKQQQNIIKQMKHVQTLNAIARSMNTKKRKP